jgi:hypothetical protein
MLGALAGGGDWAPLIFEAGVDHEGLLSALPRLSRGERLVKGAQKRISPLRCSQTARVASVEMTILWWETREQAT